MKILKPLIQQLTQIIKEGYDLGKRELPLIAHEILSYSFWIAIARSVIVMSTIGALVWVAVYLGKLGSEDGEFWIGAFVAGGAILGFGCHLIETVDVILKIKLAPRVFLLETLKSYLDN